jgi:pteridine reductase
MERPWWMVVGGRIRLGEALSKDLNADYNLVLTSSRPMDQANLPGADVKTLHWDAEDPGIVPRMMADLEHLETQGVRLSGAVLVAATFPEQPMGGWTPENLQHTLLINLTFPLLAAQALGPKLKEGACLQVVLDSAIHRPMSARLPYSAARAGLAALIPALARQWAPRVRVVGHAFGTLLPAEGSDVKALEALSLTGQLGDPADLARAVRFAAASPYLNGEILTQDGGRRWR